MDGRASVDVLARDLGVTQSTIRRDLRLLANDGALLRTYGGAAVSAVATGRRVPVDPRLAAKRAIAAAAAELVEDGQTIAISSGTTTLELAWRLVDRRLTVITNALDIAVGADRPPRHRAGRPGRRRATGHALDPRPSRRARAPRAARRHALHGDRRAELGARPDERLDPRDPDRPGPPRARRAPASSSPTRRSSAPSPRPSCSGSIESTRSSPTRTPTPARSSAIEAHGVRVIVAADRETERGDRMIEGIIPAEIAEEPAAIREHAGRQRSKRRGRPRRRSASRGVTRVHVIGNGTSYHSSLAAATLYRRHAGPDDPDGRRAHRRRVPDATCRRSVRRDAVLGISASGEFRDVVGGRRGVERPRPDRRDRPRPGQHARSDGRPRRPLRRRAEPRPGHDQDVRRRPWWRPSCVLAELLGGERAERHPRRDRPGRGPRRGRDRRGRTPRRGPGRRARRRPATCSSSAAVPPTPRRSRPR